MFHILVIEDDKHTQRLFQAARESNKYTVYLAGNGQEGAGHHDAQI